VIKCECVWGWGDEVIYMCVEVEGYFGIFVCVKEIEVR